MTTCYYGNTMASRATAKPRHWPTKEHRELFAATASLRNPDEVERFLRDLCTRSELDARQQVTGEPWEARRDARAAEVVERLYRRLGRHRGLERARAEAEPHELCDVGAALAHDVEPGDAAVDDTVLHVLGNVVRAHEQSLDRRVAAGEGECAVTRRLGAEPRVVQQLDRGLAKAPLRGDRDSQELDRRRRRNASA